MSWSLVSILFWSLWSCFSKVEVLLHICIMIIGRPSLAYFTATSTSLMTINLLVNFIIIVGLFITAHTSVIGGVRWRLIFGAYAAILILRGLQARVLVHGLGAWSMRTYGMVATLTLNRVPSWLIGIAWWLSMWLFASGSTTTLSWLSGVTLICWVLIRLGNSWLLHFLISRIKIQSYTCSGFSQKSSDYLNF